MSVTVYGIRHHGPGSARSLCEALRAQNPDVILIEGPPDANDLIALASDAEMRPPVALLIYLPNEPKQAVYYPFAEFSPEWQAIQYGLAHNVPVRFMDLPQSHQLSLDADVKADESAEIRQDPLRWIAEASGYSDSERWWEHMIEQRRDSTESFKAILELMCALREEVSKLDERPPERREELREAHMRQTIRTAEREGFERIAVVCGAWHAPVLQTMPAAKADTALLKGLAKVKVSATWVPWTMGRLTYWSGYGAGIESPGYYQHLWSVPDEVTVRWMIRVAQLLRGQDLDASSASVIEAVRLGHSLAALRDRPVPGLSEFNDAVRAVFCFGDDTPMQLIAEKLIVGELLGQVPETTPSLPLQQDLQREQKRLRLAPEATEQIRDLDLRKPNDLDRSRLLHRLRLLNISWGAMEHATGKGTFRELWRLKWHPEFAVAVIEANVWGNTVATAASERARSEADRLQELPALTALVEDVLLADLPEAVDYIMTRLEQVAALSNDIPHAMEALPALAGVLRYGNVRQTDTAMVQQVVEGLVTRIVIGLPNACSALNDDAADEMYVRLVRVHGALLTLQDAELLSGWNGVLVQLLDQVDLHGLIAGRCCRLLFDQKLLEAKEVERRMGLAIAPAVDPVKSMAWIDGFLRSSGLILLHNDELWQILNEWVGSVKSEIFPQLLPLLRRTFSTFTAPERSQIGALARRGSSARSSGLPIPSDDLDEERARKVLPLVAQILGLDYRRAQ
ncbi:MAG TPA: DUF5682 family protein [Pyrinomonadaceae bacterium]|jgi:hypothetical protein|nr:DUF5682 family protein [Pyrinomonadaceae bacterium]